jgi:ABC-type branched-subunit amino acid transport system ATPase component
MRRLLALALLLVGGAGALTPSAQATSSVPAGWYYRAQQAGAPSEAGASGVPAGKYAVSFVGAYSWARTALSLQVGSATHATLSLKVDAAASSAPETAKVLACPADSGWKPLEAQAWAAQPLFSCSPQATATYSASTSTLSVPLDPLLSLAKDGQLQVMLTPADDPQPNTNVAPVPGTPTGASWTLVLEPPALTGMSLTTSAAVPDVSYPLPGTDVAPLPAAPLPGVGLPANLPTSVLPPQLPTTPTAVVPAPVTATQAPAAPVAAALPVASSSDWWHPERWPLAVLALLGVLAVYVPSRSGKAGVAAARRALAEGADPDTALEVRGLGIRFGGVVAVDDVSFSVTAGQIVGLIGPNGAGKTTVLDAVTGLVDSTGSVLFQGVDVTGLDTAGRAELGLGRSFQDGRLFPSLTVREALAVAMEQSGAKIGPIAGAIGAGLSAQNERRVRERVDGLIELMGLTAFGDKFLSELSTGSRRIVDLAAMVAHGATLLLLDEPSSGIAQRETEALGPVLLRLREQLGCTIVIIEHDMPLLTKVADRLIAFEVGKVIADGTPEEVLEDPVVVEAYLGTDRSTVNRSGALAGSTAVTA